jgi:ribosomal protein L11 methyltransferase
MNMNWLEVSLVVNGELAEAVADVLARFAPNGVMTEQGVKYNDDEDAGTPTGPITVRAYLEMNGQIEETRQKLEESLYYLGRIQPLPAPAYKQIADQNWMEAWKQHYRPILIGQRIVIVPAWLDSPEPGRVAIKIDPGMAFGTGTHPTTQLCLELMEKVFDGETVDDKPSNESVHRPLSSVIDVGCGSGILSIAAIKLGAKSALGVDIDEESVKNARENADRNGVGEELILGVGSVNEIRDRKFAVDKAPLVVANILAPVIVRLFDAGLTDLIEDNGAIVLSGILQEQEQRVIEAGQAKGLRMSERRQMGDWVALMMSRQVEKPPHDVLPDS